MGTPQFIRRAGEVSLLDGTRKVFDAALLPMAGIPDAKITVTQTISFDDLVKGNAYYWSGSQSTVSGPGGVPQFFNNEFILGFITATPQNWGPQAVDATYTNDLPDILLGTVPDGTDRLDIKCTLTRTTDPNPSAVPGHAVSTAGLLGDMLPPIPPMGKEMRLLGGSCLLEEGANFARGFAIVLDGTDVYLRRYQSVSDDSIISGGSAGWSATNSASDSGKFTYGSAKGQLVQFIDGGSIGPYQTTSGGAFQYQRGSSNQTSLLPLTDHSDFSSEYSAVLEITPGYFNVDPTLHPPAAKKANRLGSFSKTSAGVGSASFTLGFGVPDTTRRILAAVSTEGTTHNVTSVTIGGVTATKLVESLGSAQDVSIWMASVPTGDSGDIVITYGDSTAKGIVGLAFALYHLASGTATATATRTTSGGTVSLATSAHGFAFAVAIGGALSALAGLNMTGSQSTLFGSGPAYYRHYFGVQETDGTSLSPGITFASGSGNLAAVSLA